MNKIKIGFGTIFGVIAAAAPLAIAAIGELADATQPLGVPPQTWIIASAVLAGLVVVGRYGQAIVDLLLGTSTPTPAPEPLPEPLPEPTPTPPPLEGR